MILKQPITNLERLAAELRKLRLERGDTQQAVADRAGVSRRTITNAESGANIGTRELSRIANSLGMELVLRPRHSVVMEELESVFRDEDEP